MIPLSTGAVAPAIRANEWHTFVFYLQPVSNVMTGPPGKDRQGVVAIWVDGVQIADWHHDWGCNVSGSDPKGLFELSVGPGRPASGSINPLIDIDGEARVKGSKASYAGIDER